MLSRSHYACQSHLPRSASLTSEQVLQLICSQLPHRLRVSGLNLGVGLTYTPSPSFMSVLKKAVFTSAVNTVHPSLFRPMANESSIRTDAVSVVLKTSSVFTSYSKTRSTYRACDVTTPSRFSTNLPLIILRSTSCSYTSASTRLSFRLQSFEALAASSGSLPGSLGVQCSVVFAELKAMSTLSTWRRSMSQLR